MSKLLRIILLVAGIGIILIFGPLVTGIWFQRSYQDMLSFYNSQGTIHFQISSYKRGWMSSDAALVVEITNPNFNYFGSIGNIVNKNFPKKIIFDQHIQHGPLIYQNLRHPLSLLGLAAIQNTLRITPEIKKFLERVGASNHIFQTSEGFVSFRQKYYEHIQIMPFIIPYEDTSSVQIKGIDARFWIQPGQKRIGGDIHLPTIVIINSDSSLEISNIVTWFNKYQTDEELWLGDSIFSLSKITLQERSGDTAAVSGIKMSGSSHETAGLLYDTRQVNIAKITSGEDELGPLRIQININKLNAKAFAEMVAAYREIMRRGELYRLQLRRKMYSMLPSLVTPGTNLKLETFEINTPQGKLHISGEVNWTAGNAYLPNTLGELWETSLTRAQIRISRELTNKLITFIASSPIFFSINESAYQILRKEMSVAMRYNDLTIISLMRKGLLTKKEGVKFLMFQKEMLPLADYTAEIKKLFLQHTISLQTSYRLGWQYAEVQRAATLLNQKIQSDQRIITKHINNQLNQWIKEGYIRQEQEEYVTVIEQEPGKLKVNGRDIRNGLF